MNCSCVILFIFCWISTFLSFSAVVNRRHRCFKSWTLSAFLSVLKSTNQRHVFLSQSEIEYSRRPELDLDFKTGLCGKDCHELFWLEVSKYYFQPLRLAFLLSNFYGLNFLNIDKFCFRSGFTTKAFLSKATFKSLNFLGSCGAWAFGIERFLKVLRLSALTGLIRNLLLRLSEISLAEIGLRQIWMRWLGGRSSSMSEIQKREKARRWIFKRQIKKMAKLICQLKFFNGKRIIFITPYK